MELTRGRGAGRAEAVFSALLLLLLRFLLDGLAAGGTAGFPLGETESALAIVSFFRRRQLPLDDPYKPP